MARKYLIRTAPGIEVEAIPSFLTAGNVETLLDRGFDLVLDACDSFRSKVELTAWCRRRKLPLITVGSAGGPTLPSRETTRPSSSVANVSSTVPW